ncbi:MAG: hypothetical protein V5A88_01750 [Candidatus Thermoplasmatota archaeon]
MDLLSIPNANPSLPPKVKEAREMFKYAAVFFLLAALIYFLWGFFSIMSGVLWSIIFLDASYSIWSMFNGIIRIVFAVVALILKGKLVDDLIKPIDQGRAEQIDETTMIVHIILGFIFGLVIAGVLVLLGYMKLDEMETQANQCPTCGGNLRYVAEYDNWYCDNCGDYKTPVNPPQSPSTPPPGSPQGSPPEEQPESPPPPE